LAVNNFVATSNRGGVLRNPTPPKNLRLLTTPQPWFTHLMTSVCRRAKRNDSRIGVQAWQHVLYIRRRLRTISSQRDKATPRTWRPKIFTRTWYFRGQWARALVKTSRALSDGTMSRSWRDKEKRVCL